MASIHRRVAQAAEVGALVGAWTVASGVALFVASIASATAATTPAAAATDDAPLHYSGTVTFQPGEGRVSADLDLRLPLDDDSGEIEFFFNIGYAIEHLAGPAIESHALRPMPGNDAWTMLVVGYDPQTAGDTLDMEIRYAGTPQMPDNGINQVSGDWIELTVDSAWHPVVATLLRPIDARIDLRLPEDWTVVSSGTLTPIENGVRLTTRFPQPDIAFTAGPGLESAGTDAMRIVHRGADPATLAAILDRGAACRDWLNRRFGPDSRLPPTRFTIASRDEGGYSRINYIALTDVSETSPERLTAFLCHELGHYWSRGAPPMSVENWLNEAFAEFLGALAVREMYGEDAYAAQLDDWIDRSREAGTIWTPDDPARRSYVINYKKGPWFLHRLRERIGEPTFDRLLRRYALDPIGTTPAFLDVLAELTDRDTREWAIEQLAVEGAFERAE